MTKKHPPLIQQFIDHQKEFPDAIIATEVGGFFEIWELPDSSLGHAKRISDRLDLVLTRRSKKDPNSPFMVGFPSHSAQGHFQRMVSLGETVVVVEQNIRGKKSDQNKNVTRSITRILSPGTVVENLQEEKANYFASIFKKDETIGVSLIDLSTGEVKITELLENQVEDFLTRMNPSEILLNESLNFSFKENQLVHIIPEKTLIKKISACGELLSSIYELKNPTSNSSFVISSLGLEKWSTGVLALSNLINYLALAEYNAKLLKKISLPEPLSLMDKMVISSNGLTSLEIFEPQNYGTTESNTLVGILDKCKTAMGRRCLREWMREPSSSLEEINQRLDKVEELKNDKQYYEELAKVYDIARLARRMIFGRLMPHELAQFYQSLSISSKVLKKEDKKIHKNGSKILKKITENINIEKALVSTDSSFEFFKGDLSKKVAHLHKDWINEKASLKEKKEYYEKELGRSNLKMSEKSDSFYLCGPKSLAQKAKDKNISIITKTSEIQIIDKEWTILSSSCFGKKQKYILTAKKEWEIFQQDLINEFGDIIIKIAKEIGKIDVLSNFAKLAESHSFTKPKFSSSSKAFVSFKNLRHPVVERSREISEAFIPNDVSLKDLKDIMVIYGANSAGKSTILKSVALAVFMGQIGSFVPASQAELSVFDSIMTRMTTFDSLAEGYSTFTMEMKELQESLNYKKYKSLFLFDEIGRGTSVKDGESIAYATLAYLSNKDNNSITFFATHYHDLVPELKKYENIDINHMECYADEHGKLIFPRHLKKGEGSGSYGIEVASSVLPKELIVMAKRYNKIMYPLKTSHYNTLLVGTICPLCNENPVQETHHIVEQKSGKIKVFDEKGVKKSIHDKSNLIMICASCHSKITRGEMEVVKKIKTSTGYHFVVKKL